MSTPWKLITYKNDPWHVKLKKRLARWLWNDLTKLPKPAKGYPMPEHTTSKLAEQVRPHFLNELRKASEINPLRRRPPE